MPSINYRIKGSKSLTNIYIRLRHKSVDCEVSTGLSINKKEWSLTKKKVKSSSTIDYTSINSKLDGLKTHVLNLFNKDYSNGSLINKDWLKKSVNLYFGKANNDESDNQIFLVEYIKEFINSAPNRKNVQGNPISSKTIDHYKTTLNKILNFELYKNIKLKLVDVNLKFHSQFIEYLEVVDLLNPNTIGGYIDDIKLFCNRADKFGIEINPEIKLSDFYTPKNETYDVYLTEKEINKVFNLEIESRRLDNVRDWFIIGLWTGLRISDFLRLSKENIDEDFFNITTQKTKYPVIIPIHNQIRQILKKRNGSFPYSISDQKFNDYVKEVCQLAGITQLVEGAKRVKIDHNGKEIYRKRKGKYPKNELISGHTCRRTFATIHYSKVDTMTIMKITGHKTEQEFLKYIKITPMEYAKKMKALWQKLYS